MTQDTILVTTRVSAPTPEQVARYLVESPNWEDVTHATDKPGVRYLNNRPLLERVGVDMATAEAAEERGEPWPEFVKGLPSGVTLGGSVALADSIDAIAKGEARAGDKVLSDITGHPGATLSNAVENLIAMRVELRASKDDAQRVRAVDRMNRASEMLGQLIGEEVDRRVAQAGGEA